VNLLIIGLYSDHRSSLWQRSGDGGGHMRAEGGHCYRLM
jgi:hypothetical protein